MIKKPLRTVAAKCKLRAYPSLVAAIGALRGIPEFQHLSSSAIRELESIAPSSGSRYAPDTADIYGLVGNELH